MPAAASAQQASQEALPAPLPGAACNNTTVYRIILAENPAFAQVRP